MKYRLSVKEASYLADILISISQVLFGIAAVTFFAGDIEVNKVTVITFTLILSIICWIVGWRIIR